MSSSPVPPYGVAIQEAIASGDAGKMKAVAAQAEEHLRTYCDVSEGLKRLLAEISRLETGRAGAADIIPYGDPLRAALVSGDLDRMREMVKVSENWLSRAGEVKDALAAVKKEIARLESGR